jgi:large subunit ribosomal protein L29
MKVAELRVLEEDELNGRLRTARRELYELRFKHAVGQLENSSQIAKVRHDIARIMTVLSERELGIEVVTEAPEELAAPTGERPARQEFVEEEEEEQEEPAAEVEAAAEPEMEAPVEEPAKPSGGRGRGSAPDRKASAGRGRRKSKEEKS